VPLTLAAINGHLSTVRLLLTYPSAAATINAPGFLGRGALCSAGFKGLTEMAQVLLAAGADPLQKDDSGMTPLDWAKQAKKRKVVPVLQVCWFLCRM
jgi:ankyrin repeat protein